MYSTVEKNMISIPPVGNRAHWFDKRCHMRHDPSLSYNNGPALTFDN